MGDEQSDKPLIGSMEDFGDTPQAAALEALAWLEWSMAFLYIFLGTRDAMAQREREGVCRISSDTCFLEITDRPSVCFVRGLLGSRAWACWPCWARRWQ
jgi:hypothetical protein